MNCPNCGAGLTPVPNRNHFRCAYCQTFHFPAPTGEGIILLGHELPLGCPCCARPLAAAVLDGDAVGYCPDCRGLLLSSDHLARVLTARREANPARYRPKDPIDPAELRRALRCARCGRRTDTHPYGGGGNAVIDSCADCRLVWLDAGELTVLEQFPAKPPPTPASDLWPTDTPVPT